MSDDGPHPSSSPLPSSFDENPDFYLESRLQKIKRKIVQEPLIPIGTLLTCYALYRATIAMRKGQHDLTNRMFRMRIYAQAFTIVAIVGGSMYYEKDREKRRKMEGVLKERTALEKRERWIKELEAREREESEWEERRARKERDRKERDREWQRAEVEGARVTSREITGSEHVDGAVGKDFSVKSAIEPWQHRSGLVNAVRAMDWPWR